MPISPISQVKTIAYKLDLTADIKTIYSTNLVVGSEYQVGYKIVSFNAFIKNLKAFASVPSLPEAILPRFAPTDISTQKTIHRPFKVKKHGRLQASIFRYGLDHLRSIFTDLDLKIDEFLHSLQFLSCI